MTTTDKGWQYVPGTRIRHVKRGSTYTIVGPVGIQAPGHCPLTDEETVVLYQGDDGKFWARRPDDLADGRFEALAAAPKPDITDEIVDAAIKANLHPSAEPSSTERAFMRRSLKAVFSFAPKPEPPRMCTCHPDDNPPNPCAEKYAYSECVKPEPSADLVKPETMAAAEEWWDKHGRAPFNAVDDEAWTFLFSAMAAFAQEIAGVAVSQLHTKEREWRAQSKRQANALQVERIRANQAEARAEAAEKALTNIFTTAERVRHWHDAMKDGSGMVVSADSVRKLWDVIKRLRHYVDAISARKGASNGQ